jgi:signal peptidase II
VHGLYGAAAFSVKMVCVTQDANFQNAPGRVIDRIVRFGAVTDFIFVNCGPLRTGIFNLADVFVTTGVAALLIAGMLKPGES